MLDKLLGWVMGQGLRRLPGLAGASPPVLLALCVALLASHGGTLWYGYTWGEKAGENATRAAQVAELRGAVAARDRALVKMGQEIARANEKNADLRAWALWTIDELERANDNSEKRIRELQGRPVNRCDGNVVIDEQWLRDAAAILERRGTGDGPGGAP